jgi:starch phosphorylase
LETKVVPLYYAKPDGNLPLAWIQLMRESIRSVTPAFNTHRMVKEYAERLYEPAAKAHTALAADSGKKAVDLSKWKDNIRKHWPQIRVNDVQLTGGSTILVGDTLEISANVHLGAVEPEYVTVQAYVGELANNLMERPTPMDMTKAKKLDGGNYLYTGKIPATDSGSYGFNARVIPTHPNLTQAHELRLITWAK